MLRDSMKFFEKKILLLLLSVCSISVAMANSSVTLLDNDDFKYGTYIIDKPGVYRLAEDISFNPNSPATLTEAVNTGLIPPPLAAQLELPNPVDAYHAGFPLFTQLLPGGTDDFTPGGPTDPRYDPAGFGLGFFAAIVIQAEGVVLDLAGHTIEQSAEHALLQRFFAVIELAEQPFIPNQGPADFGDEIVSAKNLVIKNGVIGRSSHHGIHGNGNENIIIKNVDFVDFEVAAIALNGVDGLVVKNSNATNRKDVPIIGTFSSTQFIKPFIEELDRTGSTTELSVNGVSLDVDDIKSALITSINNVHEDVIVDGLGQIDAEEHPAEYALFHNKFGVIDGNAYGYVVNKIGVAVNGFPKRPDGETAFPAKNVWFKNVHINSQKAFINETVAINQGGKAVIDPVGAVFQVFNVHPDTEAPVTMSSLEADEAAYLGNVAANAQAFVAKAFLNGDFDGSVLDLKRLNITADVLKWVEAEAGFETLDSIVTDENGVFCNGDSMFHVNKGVIGFKIDAVKNVILNKTSVSDIENKGEVGSSVCGDYSNAKSHPQATLLGYGGSKTRGYTFAGSENVFLLKSVALDVKAKAGSAIGVDVLTDTRNAFVAKSFVEGVSAGLEGPFVFDGPNEAPVAVGFHVGEETESVGIVKACADLLAGFGGELVVDDESGAAFLSRICR